jgi:hypothetical protein
MNKVNLQWLLSGNPLNFAQAKNSNLASVRMRAALTMELVNSNFIATVCPNYVINKNTNIIGIGKISLVNDTQEYKKWLNIVRTRKTDGLKIFIDYTDNHLRDSNQNSLLFNAYEEILKECDSVVCSSEFLRNTIKEKYEKDTFVIEDPLEVAITAPKFTLQEIPTCLWFGHASNLNFLFTFLHHNFNPSFKIRLIIMSNLAQFSKEMIDNLQNNISPLLDIFIVPWSIDNMESAAKVSDFCLIPCGINDDRKMGVSSNRLITSLALGLPCFADTALSYSEFSKFFSQLKNETIEDFYKNPSFYWNITAISQTLILKRFSKKTIIQEWRRYLHQLTI